MNRVTSSKFTRGLVSGLFLFSLLSNVSSSTRSDSLIPVAEDPVANPPSATPKTKPDSANPTKLTEPVRKDASRQPVEEAEAEKVRIPISAVSVDSVKVDAKSSLDAKAQNEFMEFRATAYCLKGRTASGVKTQRGGIAADPRILPMGSLVHIQAGRYSGTYTVTDTGYHIKGNRIDIYFPAYVEAKNFGRQKVKLKVLRRGARTGVATTRSTLPSALAPLPGR